MVSIHAPREGCDARVLSSEVSNAEFQFTHPGRGATIYPRLLLLRRLSFNSRTPGGVRPNAAALERMREQFQFTHPGRGATREKLDKINTAGKFQFTHPGRGATRHSP